MNKSIIFSLDNVKGKQIEKFIQKYPNISSLYGFKIKPQYLITEEIKYIKEAGFKLMVDHKLYDTPNVMEDQLKWYREYCIDLVTVHISSNFKPKDNSLYNMIVGVTILTTFSNEDCIDIYKRWVREAVPEFANKAKQLGYRNIVCSANDISNIKTDIRKFCPGIRPVWYKTQDDQKRKTTPKDALDKGASFIIIGRPFTQYINDPEKLNEVICKTVSEL